MKIGIVGDDEMISELRSRLSTSGATELIICKNVNEWMNYQDIDVYFDLDFIMDRERIDILSGFLPKPVFINDVVNTLAQIGKPFVRINAWPTFLEREIAEISIHNNQSFEPAENFLKAMSWQYLVVPDIAGMISPRIVSAIINEAYYTLEEDISSREDIDLAMKLGTNYPYGPFEWCQKIGLKNILSLLEALKATDERYTISSLLIKEASGDTDKLKKSL